MSSLSNVEALARAVIQVLATDNLRIKLSEEALTYSEGFSWDKVADEFMKVVRTIEA